MTASAVVVRRSVLGRACPACAETRCADPAECLHFLTSRPWADCSECAGSGWAGEDDCLSVFCWVCNGAGLEEHTARSIVHATVSARPHARLLAHIERLTAEVSKSVAVAA
ncbi:hypothetical protein OG402_26355 [Streptomyces anulatus]|uniref:hypothetical protein n=1 Tax=Streptomyces anulatus TaxID=1892 RepID=UPI00225415E4|nr:hypothetical protein [Streptomyces anulatus]MCX4603993.1 hypothetical protein [Streptomyces anulatus]